MMAYFRLAVLVVAQLGAIRRERVGQRRRWRERIPRAYGGAAIDGAERGGLVALEVDAVADLVGTLDLQAACARHAGARFEIGEHPIAAERESMLVRPDQLLLAFELLQEQRLDHGGIDVQERRQRAEINDVLEQLALARIGVLAIADGGERHSQHHNVVAELRRRQRLGGIVEEIAARLDAGHVLVPRLRVSSPP